MTSSPRHRVAGTTSAAPAGLGSVLGRDYQGWPPGGSLYTGWTSGYAAAVPAWDAIEQAEPEFAGRVRRLFDAGRHKTIATLRADGSPRISGIECEFTDGDLRFGSMTGARKGRTSPGIPGSPCTARPATLRRARSATGRGRRRSPGEPSPLARWPRTRRTSNRMGRCSSPTSRRSSSPGSTPKPPDSWLSPGPLSKGCAGSSGTSPARPVPGHPVPGPARGLVGR